MQSAKVDPMQEMSAVRETAPRWWLIWKPIYLDGGALAAFIPFPWLRPWQIGIHILRRTHPRTSMHTHVRNFWTLILRGSYTETTPEGIYHRKAGDWFFRAAPYPHHLEVHRPVVSVVFCGRKLASEIEYFPLCRECKRKGVIRTATLIDAADRLFRTREYSQGLCDAHQGK